MRRFDPERSIILPLTPNFWLDGRVNLVVSGGHVTTWTDRIAGTIWTPAGGLMTGTALDANFNGSGSITLAAGLALASPYLHHSAANTLVAVYRPSATPSGYQSLLSVGDNVHGAVMYANLSTSNTWGMYAGAAVVTDAQLVANVNHVLMASETNFDSTTFYRDSVPFGPVTNGVAYNARTCAISSNSQYSVGTLCAALYFDYNLSVTQAQALGTALAMIYQGKTP